MNKLVIILLIFGLILPSFSFAQEDQPVKAPESSAELKEIGKKILEFFPMALKGAWQEVLKIWQGIWKWFKNLWDSYIFPFFQNIWQKISDFFRREIGEKKLITEIEEEFKVEEETPKEEKNLWEKFWERLKKLIKK
ncbi:hypothetical protein KJA16_00760 [Patescibacteria group bacterium]|nr:hypothetical protein [Patescibacteria group bacterium]MBZ9578211.1 hypothetical protein [Patescibacteria group bacterium]